MSKEQFPVPEYPDLQFPGLTFYILNQKAPNYKSEIKLYARLFISFMFIIVALITLFSSQYNDLLRDVLDISALALLLLLYFMFSSFFTRVVLNSEYVNKQAQISKKHFIYRELTKISRKTRIIIAHNILNALTSSEWRLYINYAQKIDHARTVYCCEKIEQIAADLSSNDPALYTKAILKTMNNQRGDVLYLFDMFIILTDQHSNNKQKEGITMRNTKKLLTQDNFKNLK